MKFSPSTIGWYPEFIDYPNAPDDLIEVSEDLYRALLGKQIEVGPGGLPREHVPPILPPSAVTMRQARLALLSEGLLQGVGSAIDALPSPQREAARIEWEFAQSVERGSSLVALLAEGLHLDEVALDALFTQAATL